MKKLFIGLLAMSSISAFAGDKCDLKVKGIRVMSNSDVVFTTEESGQIKQYGTRTYGNSAGIVQALTSAKAAGMPVCISTYPDGVIESVLIKD